MKLRGRGSPQKTVAIQYANGKAYNLNSEAVSLTRMKVSVVCITILALVFYRYIGDSTRLNIVSNRTRIPSNPFALAPGELPGYTGWARPEQTIAGYFQISSLSHTAQQSSKYHSIVNRGEKYELLLTCINNDRATYACPSSGTLFYVRAYGPSVITGNVIDYFNSSYLIEFYPIDTGEYTVEVVVTFSAPMELHEFPLNWNTTTIIEEEEPGYEGYLVSGFPLSILVENPEATSTYERHWCNLSQLTEQSPTSSLNIGYWQIIDHVARSNHNPLTPDDTRVSLDGYRMSLNSLGVRMQYVYEDCELMHISDIVGNANEGTSHAMGRCFHHLSFLDDLNRFHQSTESISPHAAVLDVIFIGDSVMKLEMGFFIKLLGRSDMVNCTFIETNGGLQSTLSRISEELILKSKWSQSTSKRVIMFNSGLHDIDVLCSSKRRRTRNRTTAVSCVDSYRHQFKQLVGFIDAYPADMKVFRTTTAGWAKVRFYSRPNLCNDKNFDSHVFPTKYGNYGFTWPATEIQPQSRSTHSVFSFNQIAHGTIHNHSSSIYITDGYWITLPRPDHTQTSEMNQVGKHLVHPGYEVLSVFARRWLMIILWGLCGDILMQ